LWGTGGLTAGLCVEALRKHDVTPERGEVVVQRRKRRRGERGRGDPGQLGYQVAAVTGKTQAHEYLRTLGAQEFFRGEEVDDRERQPLLHQRWAGAVDTVGGNILAAILRATRYGGCVAACGLTAGSELRIDRVSFHSARRDPDRNRCGRVARCRCGTTIWRRLAGPWKPDHLELMAHEIELAGLPERIADILAGRIMGRVVVRIGEEAGLG